MKTFLKSFKGALIFSIVMLVLCGLIYPLALTGISQLAFNDQANGSLIEVNGKAVGSSIVGQDFTDARLFKCRPSAYGYNTYTEADKADGSYTGVSSGSNNYANTNPELEKRVKADLDEFLKNNPDVSKTDLPGDMLTASGSGLDPHVSVATAQIQIPAIAKASGLSEDKLKGIVKNNTEEKEFGVLGEQRVNVLKCNLEVAKLIGMIK